ncbi:MAG: phasin family protein [Ectothiorhodospiraceae bacterium]|nr:phasin family protein [Ectothiorhodospiraceae bacterium]
MNDQTFNQMNDQVEKLFTGPARAYATLAIAHFEKLASAHFEATRAYTDLGVKQVRAALDIKDPQDFRSYVEGQQKLVQEIGERVKGDAEKVVALNQDFFQQAQKLTESNAKTAAKAK